MCQELRVVVNDNTTNGPYNWSFIRFICQLANLSFNIEDKKLKTYILHITKHEHNKRLFKSSTHATIRDNNWFSVEHRILETIRTKLLKVSVEQFADLLRTIMNGQYSKNSPKTASESSSESSSLSSSSISDSESDEF